ncbi:oxygenase MpaB family protein [Nocardioides jiangxiensis]|uniref:Oxygenase MpaB family protein n=1 Tax=Nocardioides jiangxiensis TaxID=3064524 RepID=A0ABT9B1N3_9ACTN|nr:oxygenase MpaB family protein [Nocardioides sp. WY-20]MDO7867063.1 oxygenase MpaB family protein [Nocardioides sp. WY-20]
MAPHTVTPHRDHGFFAPDSVTRRVWGYPTTPLVGIQRATVIEELDPNLIAAVHDTGDNYSRLDTRYARTVQYFASVAFADAQTVLKLADVLVKIHSKAIGHEPVGGGRYDANDPDSQLWILITGWHSVLKAYEMFGPGKLTDYEERQYWAECAIAAEFQTCDPADVPRSREEVRAYFADWRPRLAASEAAQQMMDHLLDGVNAVVPRTGVLRLVRPVANRTLRHATIATMPRHMRDLAGVRQGRVTDLLVTCWFRSVMAVVARSSGLQRYILRTLSPRTLAVVEPHWRGIPPENPVVLTPEQARHQWGYVRPREAHLELRARQAQRVFGEGIAPSDEGLIESQAVLGRLA